jgi:hypothetical protein
MSGTIATALVLVVSPSLNVDGLKAYSTRGQLFDGKLDGRSVVKRSATPFCAAARVLLGEGVDSAARFIMRHEGSPHDALRSTVGVAAKLTVADSSTGKPVFVPWVDLRETWSSAARSGPPMREMDSPAVERHPRRQNSHRRPSYDAILHSRSAEGAWRSRRRIGAAVVNPFSGIFGRVSADPADATLRRAVRRAKGMAAHGASPSDIHADLAKLGEGEQAGAYYGPDYKTPYDESESHYATETDRQRANLRAFVDVGVVQAWRAGDVEWDTNLWGPDPDDPRCLVPLAAVTVINDRRAASRDFSCRTYGAPYLFVAQRKGMIRDAGRGAGEAS